MKEIKVSIYCLAYNHESYIRETLEGFINQRTKYGFKVIVHDDASTDNTANIIKEYCNNYPDLFEPIFQTENQFSKNVDVINAFILPRLVGDYVAICEGDDYWCDSNKLEKQISFLENNDAYSACVHNSVFLDMKKNTSRPFNRNVNREKDLELTDVIDGVNGVFHTSSVIYRRSILNNNYRFVDFMKSVGDYPKAILMALNGKIKYFPEQMSVYRFASTPTSWTSNNTGKFIIKRRVERLNEEIEMLKLLAKDDPGDVKVVINSIYKKKFDICVLKGEIKNIKSDEYLNNIYMNTNLKKKISIYLHKVICFFNQMD